MTHAWRRSGRSFIILRKSLLVAFLSLLAAAGPAAAQTAPDLKALIEDLVAANRILYRQAIVDGFGHVSVRHPTRRDRFFLSEAKAPGRVTTADIMEFDPESNAIDRRGRPIYSERFIHSEIYKVRPDVNAVVHTHSPSIIPFTVTQVPLRPVFNSASFLPQAVPVFEIRNVAGMTTGLVTNSARGKALAETLGAGPVVLLRGHGNVVVGPSVPRAVARAIYTEVNARLQMQALTLGGPITYIDPEESRLSEASRDEGERGHGVDRIWQLWVDEAVPGGGGAAR